MKLETRYPNLLLFYPSNKRTVAMETLVLALRDKGISIQVLTIAPKGDFHQYLEQKGVQTYSLNGSGVLSFMVALVRFCRRHKINTIHSHLQAANIVAVIAQYFIKAKTIIFRHHFELPIPGIERNQNELRGERLINRLAKQIIVPSSGVYNGMMNHERVNMKKIQVVPYIYDFERYQSPDEKEVVAIRENYKCELLLLICARHVKAKRHILAFNAIKDLIEQGKDVQLMVMDEGPETPALQSFVRDSRLQDRIHFLGFRKDFINYFKASDLLLHPSVIDASNSVVKEMAILEKTVMACVGVGDFSDYIEHEVNGFLFNPEVSSEKWTQYLEKIYGKEYDLGAMGEKLKATVMQKFSVSDKTIEPYLNLI